MRKTLILLFVLFPAIQLSVAGEQPVPARRILPEDVVQTSVQQWRMSTTTMRTNTYAVRWTYTEAGANKMLAFREGHEGQKVSIVIGSFESQPGESVFCPMPPTFTNYAQWKEGWLKYRTDKIYCVSEEDAKKIFDGLKSK